MRWKLVAITALTFTGIVLQNVVWLVYYFRYEHNAHHAVVFALSLATNIITYLLYLRFLKFMERA